MERKFNLIKSDFEKHEKRVLPRFPFCYLTFKSDDSSKVYEVKDISHTGMQLSIKNPEDSFEVHSSLTGSIHWLGKSLNVSGSVKWNTSSRLGVEFLKKNDLLQGIQQFLHLTNLVERLKPLHKMNDGLEIPAKIKYWLRADGPVEIFVWRHNDGEVAKVQVLYFDTFVEWEDGLGLQTGRVVSKRNVDTPLISEDEWLFQIDRDLDGEKIEKAKNLISALNEEHVPQETQNFIVRQLS